MVDEVARDIAEIIPFASDPKGDPGKSLTLSVANPDANGDDYDLTAAGPKGEVSQSLALKHHVSQSFLRDWSHGSPR